MKLCSDMVEFQFIFGHLIFVFSVKVVSTSDYPWLEQISRQEVLWSGCRNLGLNGVKEVHIHKLDHILVDHRHKFLYCYVPKVACTNWKRVFMVLTERSNATNLSTIPASVAHSNSSLTRLPELGSSEARNCLNNYTSFLMVRHPFERLLSAYRNKLEGSLPSAQYFQARIGRYIVKHYRPNASREDLKTGSDVSFREFVQYLITEGISNDAANEHWKPIHQLCHPCAVNYTFIGKYEKFDDDSEIVLNMIKAPFLFFPKSKPSHTSERVKYYFKQLSLDEIEALYRLYEVDFKLFGYNLESILGFDIG